MALDFLKVSEKDAVLVNHEHLKTLVAAIFSRLGVPREDAETAAEVLVTADLRGVDSHGVQYYVQRTYVPGLQQKLINPKPNIRVVEESAAVALVDGDRGLGHVVGHKAMDLAISKAKESGVAFVTVRNSTHFGIAGYYAMMALQHDMIGLAMTNATPRVLPFNGNETVLGTNPIALAAPAGQEQPFVLDMATSTVAVGKVLIADRLDAKMPVGWAADEEGRPTTDPHVGARLLKLFPLGGPTLEMGGHKGYGLATMVDVLTGVLSGAGFSAVLPQRVVGHFFGAIDIGAFRPVDAFKADMDSMIQYLHSTKPAPGHDRVLVAGEPEFETQRKRIKDGIPLHKDVVEYLRTIAAELGITTRL